MKDSPTLMSASELMLTFLSNVSEYDVKFISGLNPFSIKVDGEEVVIYIKNLSPAQLSNNNPDIWRIQLPMKDEFEKIKETDTLFFLFGYDSENMVYTTWNPYWCKQRLNVGKSVSLYSRLGLQQRVHDSGKIEQMELNNDGTVICMPGDKVYEYLKTFKNYYPEETTFVAKGSSIQKRLMEANPAENLFHIFTSLDNCTKFASHMESEGVSKKSIRDYVHYVRFVTENGYVEKHKAIFMKCSSFDDYRQAILDFVHTDDLAPLEKKWGNYIRASLNHYLKFLLAEYPDMPQENTPFGVEAQEKKVSYETDNFGKLISLDSSIIAKLYPIFKEDDYPDFELMIKIAEDYYPQDITGKMTAADWISLFRKTLSKKSRGKSSAVQSPEVKEQKARKPAKRIRVTYPDNQVVQEQSAAKTFVKVIEDNYPDLIAEMDLGCLLISKERLPDFPNCKRSQHYIDAGYYVSTNFNAADMAKILGEISDELELGLKVELMEA